MASLVPFWTVEDEVGSDRISARRWRFPEKAVGAAGSGVRLQLFRIVTFVANSYSFVHEISCTRPRWYIGTTAFSLNFDENRTSI